jgi:hypothetical protein
VSDEPEAPERVALVDEAGVERWFLLHDAFEADQRSYYLVEAADDPDQVLLLRESEGALETVGEEEFDRVIALLEAEG